MTPIFSILFLKCVFISMLYVIPLLKQEPSFNNFIWFHFCFVYCITNKVSCINNCVFSLSFGVPHGTFLRVPIGRHFPDQGNRVHRV